MTSQTERFGDDAEGIGRAADLLRAGGLVAFPTETVYGLGADATNARAVSRVFAAKGRPEFNPLIVHLADVEAVGTLVRWSPEAEALAEAFWPGPLTLVLPLREDAGVSKLVSAGLGTLAVRLPAAPVARALLERFGGPVAAPSANRSGQVSPTRADHAIASLGAQLDGVVDGGRCRVGIESTILDLSGRPTLMRPGGITQDAIAQVLGQPIAKRRDSDAISAPGQMRSHYAPDASVRLNAADFEPGEARLGFGAVACDLNLSEDEDLTEAAANLFDHLIALDRGGATRIAVSPIPHTGLGIAINDRLSRAAAER